MPTITDWVQAISTLVLVIVTIIYVWRTHAISKATEEQAKASVKMADGMREQRYDAVRPIIDIERIEPHGGDSISEGLDAMDGNTSSGLLCVLCNIGIGPAINVSSYEQHRGSKRLLLYLGTIAIGGHTQEMNLSQIQDGNRLALSVHYKDVYGREFESSREVGIDNKRGWIIGPLKISLVTEEKQND